MKDKLAEDSSVKGQEMNQVIFLSNQQLTYAKRFIADQVLLVDDTFKTNHLSLTLLVVVGVTNTGKNFPATYSFCKAEDQRSFNFFFSCLDYFIFTDDIAVTAQHSWMN